MLNTNLSNNLVCLQSSLPVSHGGLGVRSAVQLAPSAFLASAAGCTSLTRRILPLHLHDLPRPEVGLAFNQWFSQACSLCRLLCLSICVGLRLGVPLCHQCGSPVDEYALHGLSCVKSQGRHPRHNKLNDVILSLTTAGVPSQKEPYGLARSDGKCPDGVTMMPWKCGHPLIWDATCSDTFKKSYLHVATNPPGAVADLAESRKVEMYHHLKNTHIVAPVAVESSGALGSNSLQS